MKVLRAALMEAHAIQRFELDGQTLPLALEREYTRERPGREVGPQGEWEGVTLAQLIRFARGKGVDAEVCAGECTPGASRWVAAFSYPEISDEGASIIVEIHAPRWGSVYQLMMRENRGAWVVVERKVLQHYF